ncbi:MAG TPA: hypothetical protein DIW86_13385 [Pseudomonas sp.]|nr:hypothetical protein [Pseudomonas sp.]
MIRCTVTPCRSWLASDSTRTIAIDLKGLIAGKPAPTGGGVSVCDMQIAGGAGNERCTVLSPPSV